MAIMRRYVYFIGGATLSLSCYLILTRLYKSISTLPTPPNSADVIGWEHYAEDYIHPDWNTTLVNSRYKACSATNPPSVLVMVSSSTDHFALRTAIRKTWADSMEEKFNITAVFFVGKPGREDVYQSLIAESNQFGDIVVEDFMDTYKNLTIKTLMMLKWVKNNCKESLHVLKIDDDVYINTKNLAAFVDGIAISGRQDILCGHLACSGPVIRHPDSKWYLPRYMYEKEVFPDYVLGHCYLVSTEIALRLYDEAFSLPLIHIEDVFLTGLCAERLGVVPKEHHLFEGFLGGKEMKECTTQDIKYIVHSFHISAEYMHKVHAFISQCKSSPNNSEWLPTSNNTAVIPDSEFLTCKSIASGG